MRTLLISYLIHSFQIFQYQTNQKPVFQNQRVPPVSVCKSYLNETTHYKWRAKFQISRHQICQYDWLNFIHFSGYKHKIRLVSRLRKTEDHALISISTILKFQALHPIVYLQCTNIYLFLFRTMDQDIFHNQTILQQLEIILVQRLISTIVLQR